MNEIKVNHGNQEKQVCRSDRNCTFDPFAEIFGLPVMPFFARRGEMAPRRVEGFQKTKDGSYILHAEVTGMKAENLDVEFRNGGIAVKGKTAGEEDGESYSNEVEYFFTLPEDAQSEKIQANLADGVLTFRVPAKAENAPRKITIG